MIEHALEAVFHSHDSDLDPAPLKFRAGAGSKLVRT